MTRSKHRQAGVKREQLTNLDRLALWIQLRKDTTVVHWIYGLLCVFLIFAFGILVGLVMLFIFGLWEHWNDMYELARNPNYLPEGAMDFWEALLTFTIGWGILGLFQGFGLVHVSWLTGSLF